MKRACPFGSISMRSVNDGCVASWETRLEGSPLPTDGVISVIVFVA